MHACSHSHVISCIGTGNKFNPGKNLTLGPGDKGHNNTSFTIKLLAFLQRFLTARFFTAFRKKSKSVHNQTLFSSAFLQRFFAACFFTAIDCEQIDAF
jgi:hypothetical protein